MCCIRRQNKPTKWAPAFCELRCVPLLFICLFVSAEESKGFSWLPTYSSGSHCAYLHLVNAVVQILNSSSCWGTIAEHSPGAGGLGLQELGEHWTQAVPQAPWHQGTISHRATRRAKYRHKSEVKHKPSLSSNGHHHQTARQICSPADINSLTGTQTKPRFRAGQ